jgi:antigen flippase
MDQERFTKRLLNCYPHIRSGLRTRWKGLQRLSPFGSNILITVLVNIFLAGLALITGPLSARLLGPSGRGELAAVQNLFWVTATFAMIGLPEATLYFTARGPERRGRVLGSAVLVAVLTSAIISLLMLPFVRFLLASQPANIVRIAKWYLLCVPLYPLMIVPVFAIRGTNDLVRWNLIRLLPGLGWLSVLLIAWMMGRPTPGLLAGGYVVVLLVMLLPTSLVVGRLFSRPFWPEEKLLKSMLKYGFPLAGATIPQTLNLRLDQLLVAAILPPHQLGLYVVAVAWGGATAPVLNAIGNVLFARIADAKYADAHRRDSLAQGVRLGAIVGSFLAICLVVLTPLMIPLLFGAAFAPAVFVGMLLAASSPIAGMNVILEEGLRGLGDTAAVFYAEGAGVLVTAFGLLLMLRPLGILGAGIASTCGCLAAGFVLLARARQNTDMSVGILLLPRRKDFSELVTRLQGFWPSLKPSS